MTSITISVTPTEKLRFERRAKRFGFALEDFSRIALEKFVPKEAIDWKHLPMEDTKMHKSNFIRKLKYAHKEIQRGKIRSTPSLTDL